VDSRGTHDLDPVPIVELRVIITIRHKRKSVVKVSSHLLAIISGSRAPCNHGSGRPAGTACPEAHRELSFRVSGGLRPGCLEARFRANFRVAGGPPGAVAKHCAVTRERS
jgi:hypothetical protein